MSTRWVKAHRMTPQTMVDEIDNDRTSTDHYEYGYRTTVDQVFEVTLSKEIESSFVYGKLLAALRDLPHTTSSVELRLANFGGDVHQMVELFNTFRNVEVPVHVIVTAPSYSAGSMLATCGDTLKLLPGAFLMYHDYSTTEHGKGKEVTDAVNHWHRWFEEYLNLILHPFLSKKEIQDIVNDKDVYVDYNDRKPKTPIATRIKRFEKARRASAK